VVVHLDSVRYSDVDWRFSEHDLDEWRDWAIAIARKILRDERAEEVLNPYCSWCPIKLECGTYEKLPEIGVTLLERKAGRDIDSLLAWSERAKDAIKQLKAGVDEVQEVVKIRAQQEGSFESGGEVFTWEPSFSNELDKDRLIETIGADEYVRRSSVTKKALDELARGNPELKSAIEKCWSKVASGMTLGRKKVEE